MIVSELRWPYSSEVDFRTAAYFTAYFGHVAQVAGMPPNVHVLKVEVPSDATPDTPWQVTRLSMVSYYDPVPAQRASWDEPGPMGYRAADNWHTAEPDSDVHALRVRRWVAVTPLSVDMTSRVSMEVLDQLLRKAES